MKKEEKKKKKENVSLNMCHIEMFSNFAGLNGIRIPSCSSVVYNEPYLNSV
jgi:hypothetical protein